MNTHYQCWKDTNLYVGMWCYWTSGGLTLPCRIFSFPGPSFYL